MFPEQELVLINKVLDRCVVENQSECVSSAVDLLLIIDEVLNLLKHGGQLLNEPIRCRICAKGFYRPHFSDKNSAVMVPTYQHTTHDGSIRLVPFVCDYCTHFEFFAPGFPEQVTRKIS